MSRDGQGRFSAKTAFEKLVGELETSTSSEGHLIYLGYEWPEDVYSHEGARLAAEMSEKRSGS